VSDLSQLRLGPTRDASIPVRRNTGALAIPALCIGLALLACCVILPQSASNRQLVWDAARLQADMDRTDVQVATNRDFLNRLNSDPSLAERLAQRQMKMVREGSSVLDLKDAPADEISPFLLVTVPPSPDLPPLEPAGGRVAQLFVDRRPRLFIMGASLFMVAAGLILGNTRIG